MAKKRRPLIIAHRGAHFGSISRENTLKAFQKAHDLGMQAVELDIVLTCDKVPIIIHQDWTEPTLERLTKGKSKVSALKLPYNELKKYGFQSFEQIIDWALKNNMKLFVELKETKQIKELSQRVSKLILDKKAENIAYLFSKSPKLMKAFKKYKKLKRGLRNSYYNSYDNSYYLKQVKSLGLNFIVFHTNTMKPSLVSEFPNKVKVGVWRRGRGKRALNEMKDAISLGIDFAITDIPELQWKK